MTPFILYGVLLVYTKIYNCNAIVTSKTEFGERKDVTNFLDTKSVGCEKNACVEKCCPLHKYVYKKKLNIFSKHVCKEYDTPNVTLDFNDVKVYDEDRTKILSSVNKTLHMVPNKFKNEIFVDYTLHARRVNQNLYITEQGNLYIETTNFYDRWKKMDNKKYCIDYFITKNSDERPSVHVWIPIGENIRVDEPTKYYQIYADLLTSFFLLLVFLVYIILPKLRNLAGMITMAYVFCLFWAYVLLYINQNHRVKNCELLTIITYFFFMSSFCWMNVMSIDIWWTFRSYYKTRDVNHRGECKKFMYYCLYACGVPLAMTVGIGVVDTLDLHHLPWIVLPNIGKSSCFLDEGSKFLYLYIPMTILISMNWFFFLITAFNVWRLSRDTEALHVSNSRSSGGQRKLRFRFMVYLKLSVVMGLSWLFEIMSYMFPGYSIWEITDIYNLFIGLAIFIIFVVKKKIYVQLKSRFKSCGRRKKWGHSNQSTRNVTSNFIINDTFEPSVSSNPKGPELK